MREKNGRQQNNPVQIKKKFLEDLHTAKTQEMERGPGHTGKVWTSSLKL